MYVDKIRSYLLVLIEKDITKEQLRCLLATANPRQLNGFCQILYNAYDSNGLNLSRVNYSKLRKYSKILDILCNSSKYSYNKRITILRKNLTKIVNILNILKPQIRKLIEDNHI